jgi:CheY-like chemotaxis protein
VRPQLVVSDDAPFVEGLRGALDAAGAQTETDEGPTATDRLEGGAFGAVVLDVDLSTDSGWALLNRIKGHGTLRRIPLLAVSGTAAEDAFAAHAKLKTRAEGYAQKAAGAEAIAGRALSLIGAARQDAGSRRLLLISGIVLLLVAAGRLFLHFG